MRVIIGGRRVTPGGEGLSCHQNDNDTRLGSRRKHCCRMPNSRQKRREKKKKRVVQGLWFFFLFSFPTPSLFAFHHRSLQGGIHLARSASILNTASFLSSPPPVEPLVESSFGTCTHTRDSLCSNPTPLIKKLKNRAESTPPSTFTFNPLLDSFTQSPMDGLTPGDAKNTSLQSESSLDHIPALDQPGSTVLPDCTVSSTKIDTSAETKSREPIPPTPLGSFPRPSGTHSGPLSPPALPRRSHSSTSATHRRNQSQSMINFPALGLSSVPPPKSSVDTYTQNLYKSVSVPSTPGITGVTDNTRTRHTAAQEKETYTLSDRTSTLVKTYGQVPPSLIGSASVIHNNHMYVFGGRPQGGNPTSDLYVLNLDSLQWTLVDQHQNRSGDQIDTAKASEREHQDGNEHQLSQDTQQSNEVLSSVHNVEGKG